MNSSFFKLTGPALGHNGRSLINKSSVTKHWLPRSRTCPRPCLSLVIIQLSLLYSCWVGLASVSQTDIPHSSPSKGHGLTASIQDFLRRSGPSLFSRIHLTTVLRLWDLWSSYCAEWIWVLILSDTCWLGLGVMPARQNRTAFLWGWYGMTSHAPVNAYPHTNKSWPRL